MHSNLYWLNIIFKSRNSRDKFTTRLAFKKGYKNQLVHSTVQTCGPTL